MALADKGLGRYEGRMVREREEGGEREARRRRGE